MAIFEPVIDPTFVLNDIFLDKIGEHDHFH